MINDQKLDKTKRDTSIIKHILDYCLQIETTLEEIHHDYKKLLASNTHKNALALCILQIGELSSILSGEFKSKYSEIPWRDIKIMRNIVAHKYGEFNVEMLWNTVQYDIPELRDFCENFLALT